MIVSDRLCDVPHADLLGMMLGDKKKNSTDMLTAAGLLWSIRVAVQIEIMHKLVKIRFK